MKKLLIAFALAFPLVLASVQTADASEPTTSLATSKKRSECAKAKKLGKACKITFDTGSDLEGGVVSPDGVDVYAMMNAVFGDLIKLRWDFVDQIVATADDIPL